MNPKKLPFKRVEIPVTRLNEETIPFHVDLFKKNKARYEKVKLNGEAKQILEEASKLSRVVQQIGNILYELDTLRAQVENSDLDKFDALTLSSRKELLNVYREYTDFINYSKKLKNGFDNSDQETAEQGEGFIQKQIVLNANIEDLKILDKERQMHRVLSLQNDIQDLNEIYNELGQMVHEQAESVNKIEENIEEVHENVEKGGAFIAKAAKYNSVYPITGAIVGTCVGGPIGMVAGLKIGALTGLSCAGLGYYGGKLLKKRNQSTNDLHVE